ncbi:2-oxo-4-hydroxy-4-carboxy-5-ureidoimidazoline decarboxylase [Nonomuraea sp. LP-02]|uniref:2-oxo-4-hydroxy-4-carboxy-5-ureidoimidazoline decarboxylase n=1 Tax=Nonomuraea wenchangensis TaxID=568860 RepID=A0A1H9ZNX8_9ACTN|nr:MULTISPECIES: 2-oxo-4-hydroxy-4-carboxy-5-ureidoimidazoline decarboxylase [Nonomuraea]MED7925537.1 2-oxo-4-hydroxy-4-carboxy-5-ureidoimidazoline decarboxylase [Nonomuraea sp. LP-02]SES83345.1 2-oxo-4-hydroxy-4-carboxy-5-ureidoimidazoline decarboxylase [Nonomuraea wenchangensis]
MPATLSALAAFNAAPAGQAEEELRACCASTAFAARVAAGRPYGDLAGLLAAAEAAAGALAWPDVLEALAAHPRIGERPAGAGREAAWSRQEQSGVGDDLRAALAEGNRAYEARFGHVYLVCATGLGGAELLARLRERLGNDEERERAAVRGELAKITRLRLVKLMGGGE